MICTVIPSVRTSTLRVFYQLVLLLLHYGFSPKEYSSTINEALIPQKINTPNLVKKLDIHLPQAYFTTSISFLFITFLTQEMCPLCEFHLLRISFHWIACVTSYFLCWCATFAIHLSI